MDGRETNHPKRIETHISTSDSHTTMGGMFNCSGVIILGVMNLLTDLGEVWLTVRVESLSLALL